MKKIFLLVLLLPLLLTAQRNRQCKKCQDPCTGCAAPAKDTCNKTPVITINNSNENKLDSALLVLSGMQYEKHEGKTFWDKYSNLFLGLIPILLGFLAYRYAIKQMVAKTRMEWIERFRKAANNFSSSLLMFEIDAEDFDKFIEYEKLKYEIKELARKIENVNTNKPEDKMSELETKRHELKDLENAFKETDNDTKDIFHKQYSEFKNTVYKMYESLNDIYFLLDPDKYPTQKTLQKKIDDFFSAKKSDSNNSKEQVSENSSLKIDNTEENDGLISLEFAKKIKPDIQKIAAEQWRLAEGKTNLDYSLPAMVKRSSSKIKYFFRGKSN